MQEIKPTGKYLKSYEAGFRARHNGAKIESNPNYYCPDVAMSSWWEAGWMKADKDVISSQTNEEWLDDYANG